MQNKCAAFQKYWHLFRDTFKAVFAFRPEIFACDAKLQRKVSFFELIQYSDLETLKNFHKVNENQQVEV